MKIEDVLIGKIIKDSYTGDIGKIVGFGKNPKYYLVRWKFLEEGSYHDNKREEKYALYTKETLHSKRFEFITQEEAFLFML